MRVLHPSLAVALLSIAVGCGSTVEIQDESSEAGIGPADVGGGSDTSAPPSDAPIEDTQEDAASDAEIDAAPVDTGPPPTGCAAQPLAVDPSSALDPSKLGPLPVAKKTFTLPKLGPLSDVKVLVTYPSDAAGKPHPGRHAWIMFHHAVHGPAPGVVYDDYPTIHGHWASHGFVVFSIDGSRIFFPGSSGSSLTFTQQQTVASMMSEAITWFLDEQEKSEFELGCTLDAARGAVAGHSRGGGATLLVPTTRDDGAKIKALVSFQGVDPGSLNVPEGAAFPGLELPAMWLDAALDGDVIFPINPLQYGRAKNASSLVTILGSKHTFTFDENALPHQGGSSPTILPAEHKEVCNQYTTAFLRARVRDASPSAADLDRFAGPGGLATTASSGGILLSYRPASSAPFVAKLDQAPGTTPLTNDAGATITTSGSMIADALETYGSSVGSMSTGTRRVSKEVNSARLQWDGTGGAVEIPVAASAFAGKKAVAFDLAMTSEGLSSGTTPLFLEVVDTSGGVASVAIADHLGAGWFTRPRRLSTAWIPLSKLTGVDLTKAKSIRVSAKSGAKPGTAIFDALRTE